MRATFEAPLWRWEGGAWHFVTLPDDVSDEIADHAVSERRGFGSVRVIVTVGSTTWRTSVFPDTKSQAYVLPVKKSVRDAEDLVEGVSARVSIELA